MTSSFAEPDTGWLQQVWQLYRTTLALYDELLPKLLRPGSLYVDLPDRLRGLTVSDLRELRLELELQTTLTVLTSVEAAFYEDYEARVNAKLKDGLSRHLRELHKRLRSEGRDRPHLEDDLLDSWKATYPERAALLGTLAQWWKTRHWLAHGRYWTLKSGKPPSPEELLADLRRLKARLPLLPFELPQEAV